MTQQKKVLLVVYAFPPFPGIGGRRWAKFAKYLKRADIPVEVVCARYTGEKKSQWTRDVQNIIRHEIDDKKGRIISSIPESLIEKINYHLTVLKAKLANKGWYYDYAFFIRNQVRDKLRNLLESKEFSSVIVSGAPYHLCHHVVSLKSEFPEIKFLVDYRDAWTGDTEKYGQMPTKILEYERKLESEVVIQADHIVTVNETIASDIHQIFNVPKNKITAIPNGYDTDDIPAPYPLDNKPPLKFVFAGSLYNNLDYILNPFIESVSTEPLLREDIIWDFYGSLSGSLKDYINKSQKSPIHFHGFKSKEEIGDIIAGSNACLLFIQRVYKDSFSTKFIEYYAAKKPLIVFGERGRTADYVEEKGIGVAIAPEDVTGGLLRAFKFITNLPDNFNERFDDPRFELSYLTAKLSRLLK